MEIDWQAVGLVAAAIAAVVAAAIAYRANIRAVEAAAEKGLERWKLEAEQERERWAWEAQQAREPWQRTEEQRHRQAGEDAARKVRDLLLAASALFDHRHQAERRARWKTENPRVRHFGLPGPARAELDPLLAPVPSLTGEIPDAELREFVRQAATVLEQWEPAYEQLPEDGIQVNTIGWRVEAAVQAQLGAFIRGERPDPEGMAWVRQAHDAVEEWWDLHADPD